MVWRAACSSSRATRAGGVQHIAMRRVRFSSAVGGASPRCGCSGLVLRSPAVPRGSPPEAVRRHVVVEDGARSRLPACSRAGSGDETDCRRAPLPARRRQGVGASHGQPRSGAPAVCQARTARIRPPHCAPEPRRPDPAAPAATTPVACRSWPCLPGPASEGLRAKDVVLAVRPVPGLGGRVPWRPRPAAADHIPVGACLRGVARPSHRIRRPRGALPPAGRIRRPQSGPAPSVAAHLVRPGDAWTLPAHIRRSRGAPDPRRPDLSLAPAAGS
ncbi:unnamed protein product [Urochloa humidicola]